MTQDKEQMFSCIDGLNMGLLDEEAASTPAAPPECTCGGRVTLQHRPECPMGKALAAPPEGEHAMRFAIGFHDGSVGDETYATREEAVAAMSRIDPRSYVVLEAPPEAETDRAVAERIVTEWNNDYDQDDHQGSLDWLTTGIEAALATARAEARERGRARLDMAEAMVTQKYEQYIAERHAHEESRAEIERLQHTIGDMVSEKMGYSNNAADLAKARAALELFARLTDELPKPAGEGE